MPAALSPATIQAVGLHRGEPIRFKRLEGRRWQIGTIRRIEIDGSITLHDADGSARSHPADAVMVRRPGKRGRLTWQYVSDVAVTWQQLSLFIDLESLGVPA